MESRSYHNRQNQQYDDYWKYTAAFTDFEDNLFIGTLRCCIDFIDATPGSYSSEKYHKLQTLLQSRYPLTGDDALASQRKRINQFIKIGAIKPYLTGYALEVKDFLETHSAKKRKSIISKIIYQYANILSSATSEKDGKHINFFIKTLESLGKVTEIDLATIMTIDIATFGSEFATNTDLVEQRKNVDVQDFIERKYNQVSHFRNLLTQLEDIVDVDKVIYFKTDAEALFGSDYDARSSVRDPYLQRIYKSELEAEACSIYHSEQPKCMLEGLAHPVMIASHIKPYSHCNEDERFDPNNGLLLSKNTDSLFDLGYITFDNNGNIIPSKLLDADMKNYVSQYRLNQQFINSSRMDYMEYHRSKIFERRYSTPNARKFIFQES